MTAVNEAPSAQDFRPGSRVGVRDRAGGGAEGTRVFWGVYRSCILFYHILSTVFVSSTYRACTYRAKAFIPPYC